MTNRHDVLLLRLEGVLQSWGEMARWTVRDTRLEPTKSGVVGLLAACLGWGVEDDQRIAELAAAIRLGVRVDRPGRVVRDYHTVSDGVLSAEGRIKINATTRLPETVVSERYYLADACFLVGIESDVATIDRLEQAVQWPVWSPYLGRKSCVLSAPLYPALPGQASRLVGSDLESALKEYPWIGHGEPTARVRLVVEAPMGSVALGWSLQRRRDVPLSLALRRFGHRDVYETMVALAPAASG